MPAEQPGKRSGRAHVSADTYTAPDWGTLSTSPRAAGSSSSASGAAAPTPAGPDPPPTPPVSRPSSPPDPVQTGPAPRLYRKQTGGITGPFRREFNANPEDTQGFRQDFPEPFKASVYSCCLGGGSRTPMPTSSAVSQQGWEIK